MNRFSFRIAFRAAAFATAVFGVALSADTASARSRYVPDAPQMQPWCALVEGTYDCSYYTQAQCDAAVSGWGKFCFENPRVVTSESDTPSYSRRKRIRH